MNSNALKITITQEHIGIVESVTKKFEVRWLSKKGLVPQDLSGPGFEAILKSAKSWDSSSGVPYSAYLRTCAYNAMIDFIRAWKGGRTESLANYENKDFESAEGDELGKQDKVFFEFFAACSESSLEERLTIRYGVQGLPDKTRTILMMLYGLDGSRPRSVDEIALHLGLRVSEVVRAQREGLGSLRVTLGAEQFEK